ncbi:MAG TPA: outer membrane protein transport protein [bacterium]
MDKTIAGVGIVAVLVAWAPPAVATNGLNVIGFGGESVAMGGADLAVARDTTALNTNPAGLAQIPTRRVDFYGSAAYTIDVSHRDALGNDEGVDKTVFFGGDAGCAVPVAGGRAAVGIGIFGQGGAGIVYDELNTPFGNRDELSNQYGIARITPGVALRVNDALFLGASAVITYAQNQQRFFPDTSFFDPADPAHAFFGSKLDDMDAVDAGLKVGAMVRPASRVTLGVSYTSQVDLELDGGELVSNQTAAGFGQVTYRDVTLSGAGQPQELGVGVAWQASETLLVAAELTWLDWSRAARRSRLRARDPDRPAATPVIESDTPLNWRDQYVIALGLAWDVTERTVLRAGYNYGRNPIPDDTLNPLLPNIAEHHLTAGAGHRLTGQWRMDVAVEYQLPHEVTYTNPDLPFGPDAQEHQEFAAVHVMVSRQW